MSTLARIVIDNADADLLTKLFSRVIQNSGPDEIRELFKHFDIDKIDMAIAQELGYGYCVPRGGQDVKADPFNDNVSTKFAAWNNVIAQITGMPLVPSASRDIFRYIDFQVINNVARIMIVKSLRAEFGFPLKESKQIVDYFFDNEEEISRILVQVTE